MENTAFIRGTKTRSRWKLNLFETVLTKRYLVTLLVVVGYACLYFMRTNLSVAIIEMTSDKNVTVGNATFVKKAPFSWNSKEKGFLLSLFAYGYIVSPIFGGVFAIKFGGCTVFGLSVAMTAILTILSPFFFHLHFLAYSAVRIAEGLLQAIANPACVEIFIQWAPIGERSRMILAGAIGSAFGGALNYPLSGYVAYHYGWEAVFFVTGGISLLWFGIWVLAVKDTPEKDKFISKREKEYLKNSVHNFASDKNLSYPWKTILTSRPVWAVVNEYFSYSWSYSFVSYCLPLFIKDVHNVSIQDIGLISGIPVVCTIIGQVMAAYIADYLRIKEVLRVSNLHRVFIGIGQIGILIAFIILGLSSDFLLSIFLLSIIRIFYGISNTSYTVLPIDLFGSYASLIKGMCVTAFGIGCLLNPTIMGFMVTNHTRSEWNIYFLFLSMFNIWSLIIYFLYGSGKLQLWASNLNSNGETNCS